ncbi:MAG: cytochrome c5 family protein [Thiopseudomonas sp.]|nr:cytochrome c5 family protein [Thiopseudomonas sp.]
MSLIKKILVAQATALIVMAGASAQAASDDVAARLKPVGDVCIEGQECAAAAAGGAAPAAAGASAARSGDDIVAKSCGVCHATGLLEAPITGDKPAWAARAEVSGGLDGLLAVAKAGRGAMPPGGTCGDCSDEELMNAIKTMSGL